MAGVRQRRLAILVVAMLAGCLDSPPSGVSGTGADAAVPGEADGAPFACSSIVRNKFDDTDEWDPYEDPEASVTVASDEVHITVAATEDGAWGEITAVPTSPIMGTEMVVTFTIGEGANGTAGIAWAIEAGDDYYEFAVDGTQLVAIDAPDGDASATVLCDACPVYDPEAHARIRLRAFLGNVHFQAAPAEGEWVDIASAPIRSADDFEAVAYGWADAGETSDMTVTELVWRKCDF